MIRRLTLLVPVSIALTLFACKDRPDFTKAEDTRVAANGVYRDEDSLKESKGRLESLGYSEFEISNGQLVFRRMADAGGSEDSVALGVLTQAPGSRVMELEPAADLEAQSQATTPMGIMANIFAGTKRIRVAQAGNTLVFTMFREGAKAVEGTRQTLILRRQAGEQGTSMRAKAIANRELLAKLKADFIAAAKKEIHLLTKMTITSKPRRGKEIFSSVDVEKIAEESPQGALTLVNIKKLTITDAGAVINEKHPAHLEFSLLKKEARAKDDEGRLVVTIRPIVETSSFKAEPVSGLTIEMRGTKPDRRIGFTLIDETIGADGTKRSVRRNFTVKSEADREQEAKPEPANPDEGKPDDKPGSNPDGKPETKPDDPKTP